MELPEGWESMKLNNVLSLNQSGVWGDESNEREGFPVLRSTNIHDGKLVLDDIAYRKIDSNLFEKHQLKNNDILITKSSGSAHLIGKSCMFIQPADSNKYLFSNFTQRLRADKSKILPKFLFYFLNSNFGKANLERAQSTTTGLRNLKMTLYSAQPVIVPPLETQHKIVEILERTDALRKKRREAGEKTSKILQAAFVKLFGDPVRNEMGWEMQGVGDITTKVGSGLTPKGGRENYLDSGVLFIRSQNVKMNYLDFSDIAHISDELHEKMKRTWVENGDVLLNITGASIGRVCYFNRADKANVNQHVCIIRLNKAKALPQYVSFYLSTNIGQAKIMTIQSGATRQGLNYEQVKSITIPLPPLELQQKFARLVENVESMKERQTESNTQINEMFQGLMQKAFRGELAA